MQDATRSYHFNRTQCNMLAISACADASMWHGIAPDELARHLIDTGAVTGRDADKLELLASDVCAMRAAMI